MSEKTDRPNLFNHDKTLWTIVFSSQNGPANPPEEITARRVLDTFDRSKVSGEILMVYV